MAEGILNPIPQLEADFDFDVYTKQEVDALLDEKADKVDTYTKTETDTLLSAKADADSVYTKTETDTLLSAKADADAVYTKAETDTLLGGKADKSTTLAGYGITDAYTKTEADNLLNAKADASNVYTKSEIDTKIPNSVGSTTKPVYVSGGVVSACTYELNKTVPANAVFTDTTYTAGNGLNLSGTSFSAKAGTNVTVDGNGINVNGNGAVASANTGLLNGGTAYTELRPTLDGTWVKNAQTTGVNLQKLEGGIEYLYAILSKQYDQLKKYINGNYYDYDTDTDSKYVKTVPQGAMPYASLDSVGGKTVVWNQINKVPTSYIINSGILDGVTVTITDGVLNVVGTPTEDVNFNLSPGAGTIPANHKLLFTRTSGGFGWSRIGFGSMGDVDAFFHTYSSDFSAGIKVFLTAGTTYNFSVKFNIFDLTLLYGSGNEPTTVAEFQQMFPAPYYAFNQGTLLSAGVTEVKSVGKNLADYSGGQGVPSDTDFANTTKRTFTIGKYVKGLSYNNYYQPTYITALTVADNSITITNDHNSYGVGIPFNCLAGEKYVVSYNATNGGAGIGWYTNDGTYISGSASVTSGTALTVPANAKQGVLVLRPTTANTTATCSNVQIEKGTTATAYTPYQENSYPIPAEIQALEGYGWSAGTVYNYIDFEAKKFVKRVASVDLGSLTWINNDSSSPKSYVSDPLTLAKAPANSSIMPNIVVPKYNLVTHNNYRTSGNITMIPANSGYAKRILICDDVIADKTALKTSLDGVYLYYELETPVEVDISAYITDDNLIEVEAGGTLTFENQNGDDYRIPIPSAETYMVDLQASL